MGTVRIARLASSPSTEYWLEADIVGQSGAGNYTTVRIYRVAINRGGTSSFSSYSGSQTTQIDGIGSNAHTGTLPSGYADNQVRWDEGPYDYNVPHNADGFRSAGVTLRQIIAGWHGSNLPTVYYNDTAALGGFARIPKPPTIPGTPVASEQLPTSLRLTWTAPTDNKGSAIVAYVVRRWNTPDGSGPYVDTEFASTALTQVLTGLEPGKQYTWAILAKNGSYGQYSVPSAQLMAATMAPVRYKVAGNYKYGIPYRKVAGVYKTGIPFKKVAGHYKQAT